MHRWLRRPKSRTFQRYLTPLWIYLAVVIVFALLESTLMYPAPKRSEGDWNPTWLGHEDVYIETSLGNTIHGWYVERPQSERTILLIHGNGVHLGYMAQRIEMLGETYNADIFAFDYRGYGKSKGSPSETGLLVDAEAAHDWLQERSGQQAEEIVIWGRSLGGALATHLAGKRGAGLLVLDRTFDSMVNVASSHYPWLPVRWILSNRYPSSDRISKYEGPLFQVHGRADRVVPFSCGAALFEAAASKEKEFIESESLAHNEAWPDDFHRQLQQFMASIEL